MASRCGAGESRMSQQEVGGELVVRDEKTGRIHFLNAVATDIWKLAAEQKSVEEIVAVLCVKYDVKLEAQVRADVERCLDEFSSCGPGQCRVL